MVTPIVHSKDWQHAVEQDFDEFAPHTPAAIPGQAWGGTRLAASTAGPSLAGKVTSLNLGPAHPSQAASGHHRLQAVQFAEDAHSAATLQKTKAAPFADIKEQTKPLYEALRETQVSVHKALSTTRTAMLGNAVQSQQIADVKAWRDDVTGSQTLQKKGAEAYAALKQNTGQPHIADLLGNDSALKQKGFPLTGGFRDPATGLYAELRKLPQQGNGPAQYVLCITGTGRGAALRAQMKTNAQQFLGRGGVPAAHQQALQLTKELQQAIHTMGGNLTLAGHSLGGGIANYVGLKLNMAATCFNAAALGGACLQDLERGRHLHAETVNKQCHVRTHTDPVSSKGVQKFFACLIASISYQTVRVPEHIGQRYTARPTDAGFPQGGPAFVHNLFALNGLYQSSGAATKEPEPDPSVLV
ncbi:MAG: hypothetical protein WBJ21_12725 [Burkholderiaceae bacterium]